MTKKRVFWVSGLITIALLAFDHIGTFQLCGGKVYGECMTSLANIMRLFLPIIPFFLFSLITYKLRDEVFYSWFGFAKWWIPLSMVLTLITPSANGGYFVSLWDDKMTALFTSFIFIIVSLIIVIYKLIRLRGK